MYITMKRFIIVIVLVVIIISVTQMCAYMYMKIYLLEK